MMGGGESTASVTRRTFLRTAGGATAAAATAGAAAGQDETTTDGTPTEGGTPTEDGTTTGEGGDGTPEGTTEGTTEGGNGGGGGETHTVDMTDELVFDPEEITIAPGDTVVWENVGQVGHSVTAYEEEIPDDAEYFASGGLDSEQAARDAYPEEGDITGGESYEHTFETTGEFGYFCIPHESVGMVGTVVVEEGGGGGDGAAGDGGGAPTIPDSAKTLGVISTSALLSILALAYVFLKYGGDYGEVER